jgi:predicted dehydrogenase
MRLQKMMTTPKTTRWGVLGTATIAVERVIPSMRLGERTEVLAIASRDAQKAREAAERLGIPRWYGSYEELLADTDVDAVYIPLPNHLHAPWSARAAQAGKHVLCEKPIALSVAEVRELIRARNASGVQIAEAFMVRTHPQWLRAKEILQSGRLGTVALMTGTFSYFNRDPVNVRNVPACGGGTLMDIGCYPITLARMLFGEEPREVFSAIERDPEFHVDRRISAILRFSSCDCTFTCSTQLAPYQRVHLLGTKGRLEIEIPLRAPWDRPTRLLIDDCSSLHGEGITIEEIPTCNSYTIQGDLFSRAIADGQPPAITLEDSMSNMAVIEALFRSAESRRWEVPAL